MNGIELGKKIFTLLSEDPDIKAIVGDRIYPLVADNETPTPFIVWAKSITPFYTKGIPVRALDEVTLTINCVSDKYFESANIATAVRNVLEDYKEPIGQGVQLCRINTINESFQDDAYIQTLVFDIKY